MHQFPKFTPAWNSACFRQFLCPSSGIYSLYTRHWYISYRFVDSFWAGPGWNRLVWHIPVPSVQWINSWWWAEELPETCRVSCRSKFGKLVHLVGFIIKKFVMLHCHMNVKNYGLATAHYHMILISQCCIFYVYQLFIYFRILTL